MRSFCHYPVISLLVLLPLVAEAQQPAKKPRKPAPFHWVNSLPKNAPKQVQHATFYSEANQTDVGYCYLLPEDYANSKKRYPVVYWLHGGRPGGETKTIKMADYFQAAMEQRTILSTIYVFPNGGKLSHYDHGEFKGEQAFLELIQHVDKTYRTIADRKGRAIEGFSQGGRGTGRYMFKHAKLFCSAAPLGGGHQHEKRISESDGKESESLTISPAWNNTWDLARRYADDPDVAKLKILISVGTGDFNHEANKEWSQHLVDLGIQHEFITVPDIPHSSQKMYEKIGDRIMKFHAENFRRNGALED